MPISLTGHRPSVLGQGWWVNHKLYPKGGVITPGSERITPKPEYTISGGPSPGEGFPTIGSLTAFRGPILLVSSTDDPVFPPGTSAAIAAAHHGPDTLLVVPGNQHALQLLDGPYSHRITTAIDAFLARLL
jgi:pimeloyl-ACP methyl ester carboxylesterase